jgi:MFS family permease
MTLLSDNIHVLFLGRVLGGISGTLLWSVFESWLVAEFNKLMLEETETPLAAIFSMMTTSNTCVAIVAGLVAEWLVRVVGTAKAPFMLSIGCLSMAFVAISKYWVSTTHGCTKGLMVLIILGRKLWCISPRQCRRRSTSPRRG